jgi:transposase-like protein
MKHPESLQEAIVYFSDPERAFRYAVELRWPDARINCPRCGSEKHSFIKTRRIWFCYGCKKQFTLKVGTIFEDSALGMDKWMAAFWMICNCKNGISSYELARAIKVTQKSTWFMLHRIREAMKSGSIGKLGGPDSGPVEADEVFIGPKLKTMHASRRARMPRRGIKNVPVMGMLDRESRQVRAKVVPNVSRETLQNEILEHVEKWSKLYTDGWQGYDNLDSYVHKTVNHIQEYVRGEVHTQGIENFWSLLKRTLRGTYVAVEPFHLDRYVTEQVFRFNNRATKDNPLNDADRFTFLMSQVAGKRLTYAELTGKGTDSLHPPTAGAGQEVPF